MAIYKIKGNNEKLVKVDTTSLGQEDVWERELQRMLRDRPEVLEDELLIISEEFGNWQDAKRRIDLLGLDAAGRLVVIELKRGYTGEQMDLQAIRYAAMVANMGLDDVTDAYQKYLEKRADNEPDRGPVEEGDSESYLREHLKIAELDNQAIDTAIPRIILASEDFGKELTTCVLWLNDSWLRNAKQEIKCVRLQPHKNGGEIFIEASVVIPLPEASDYQTQLGQREQEARSVSSGKVQIVQGADAFKESIGRAPEKFQPGLERLYVTAMQMEQERIVELSTYISRKGDFYKIDLTVPGTAQNLVSFNNLLKSGKERGGEISFLPSEGGLSLNALAEIDGLIGEVKSSSGVRHRRLSRIKESELDPILAAIRDLYLEASGHQIEAASADD